MIRVLRYLKGYVKIKIWGFAPERFLNLCSRRNIMLWEIQKEKDTYLLYISLSGFWSLREIARKTKTRVVILKRYGLPFFLSKIRERSIFLTGAFFAFLAWFLSGLFIWNIQVEGNYKITDNQIRKYLKTQGISETIPKKNVNIEEIEKSLREQFQEFTWVSVKIDGTDLYISIKENDLTNYAAVEERCMDLWAEKDGMITSMIVKKGVAQVKPGDMVSENMLLVSGEIPVYNDDETIRKYLYTAAEADIFVKRTVCYEDKLPPSYIRKVYTGRTSEKVVCHLWGNELTLGKGNTYRYYDTTYENKSITLWKGITLPIRFGVYHNREYYNMECRYTLKDAENILAKRYRKYVENLENEGGSMISGNVYMDFKDGYWTYQGEIEVEEKIGIQILR